MDVCGIPAKTATSGMSAREKFWLDVEEWRADNTQSAEAFRYLQPVLWAMFLVADEVLARLGPSATPSAAPLVLQGSLTAPAWTPRPNEAPSGSGAQSASPWTQGPLSKPAAPQGTSTGGTPASTPPTSATSGGSSGAGSDEQERVILAQAEELRRMTAELDQKDAEIMRLRTEITRLELHTVCTCAECRASRRVHS